MHTPSSWPNETSEGICHKAPGVRTDAATNSTWSRQASGQDSSFLKYMRPITSPVPSCFMGHRPHYGNCGPPIMQPHYHMRYPGPVPMVPIYYPHGPPRLPPHMMASSPMPHRHPHMGCVQSPLVPPFPSCYPYQHNTRPGFGSPRTPVPSTHSWNQYKYAMQKSIPQRYTPTKSSQGPRMCSPRTPGSVKSHRTTEFASGRGRGGNRGKGKKHFHPCVHGVSDSPRSDDDFNPTDEESDQSMRSRSKYRTLLHELAVNNQPTPVFNSSIKPQTLRQAICMYIDYLTHLNENRVRVAEFNTAPLMDPGFDYEDYYHEALNEDVHFPSTMFKNWLACYGVSIEVTDDPDGTDPGEKIVVITNLGNPKTETVNDQVSSELRTNTSEESSIQSDQELAHVQGESATPAALAKEQNDAQQNIPTTDTNTLYVPIPSSSASRVTETMDDGCVITLIDDDSETAAILESENAEVTNAQKRRKCATKRKANMLYNSPDLITNTIDTYLPPRKSCVDKREKNRNYASKRRSVRSGNSTPKQEQATHHPPHSLATGHHTQDQIEYFTTSNMEQIQDQYGNAVYAHTVNEMPDYHHVLDGTATAVPVGQVSVNQASHATCIDSSSPVNNRSNMLHFAASPVTPSKFVEVKNVHGFCNNLANLQPNQNPITESKFAALQRGLHTPIFDEFGNTPFKEYTAQVQEPHSGHMQLNDPVLIETAGKRVKALPAYEELTSEDSSRDSTGSNVLDGIQVLSSPNGSSQNLIQSMPNSQSSVPVGNRLPSSAGTKNTADFIVHSEEGVSALGNVDVEFQCPFTGENLTTQVQAALTHKVEAQDQSTPTQGDSRNQT